MPRPGKQTTERAKDFKGTLRQLLSALRQYKLSLIVVMVFAILSTIFNIAGPKILAKATTALATGWIAKLRGIGSIDFAYIGKILLILLAMYLCSAAFSFIQGWLMTGLSQKVCYDFRRQISEKINRLPLAYFEKRTVGEVLSRITNDVDTLGQSLNQSVTQLITSITTMIGVLIMMLSISPKMTLIALLILPVSLVLVMLVVRFSQKYFKAQQATLGVVNGQVEEVYSGHNVIKAFNREAAVLEDFNAANDKLFESAWKSQFLSGLMQPIMNFVGLPAGQTLPASMVRSPLTMSGSVMCPKRPSSTISAAMCSPARRSPSSAPPVPARPPWSSCLCGSTMWIPAPSP